MTSHELAKYLLAFPDLPMVIYDPSAEWQDILATEVKVDECELLVPIKSGSYVHTSKGITAIRIS